MRTVFRITGPNTFFPKPARARLSTSEREGGAGVVHGQEDTEQLEGRVEAAVSDVVHGVQEQADAAQGPVAALQGDDHGVSGGESIEGRAGPGWGAINQDEIVVGLEGASTRRRTVSRFNSETSCSSAADRSMLAGRRARRGQGNARMAEAVRAAPKRTW